METIDNQDLGSASRPTFLTVLCILTFIGSGLVILQSLVRKDPTIEAYAGYYYWVSLALSIGTLYGAMQMWKLKKMGLYIWTACEVLSVAMLWFVVKGLTASMIAPQLDAANELDINIGAAANTMVEGVMNTMLMIGSIFPGVFVLLYWLNAKHLK